MGSNSGMERAAASFMRWLGGIVSTKLISTLFDGIVLFMCIVNPIEMSPCWYAIQHGCSADIQGISNLRLAVTNVEHFSDLLIFFGKRV